MKYNILCHATALLSLVFSSSLSAATNAVDQIEFKDKKVVSWPGGQALVAPNEITLPFDIVVKTNGTFTVKKGKVRELSDGDVLGADGMLTKPDGTIRPVMDHLSLNRGHVVVVKDGEASEPDNLVQLGDGSTVAPDGKLTPRNSSPRRLLDGEIFLLDGTLLLVRDSITLRNGRVMVQKDGSKLTVEPARSITMNDGTKVLGDGTIIKTNGEHITLREGQVLSLDGVVSRPR